MKQITIKLKKLLPGALVPEYSHRGESGDLAVDLFSAVDIDFAPGEIKNIRTGIALEFPPGFGGLVADRSGLALRGFTTLAGVVDPGYRGEVKVVAANLSSSALHVKRGDRIAQLIVMEKIEVSFLETTD